MKQLAVLIVVLVLANTTFSSVVFAERPQVECKLLGGEVTLMPGESVQILLSFDDNRGNKLLREEATYAVTLSEGLSFSPSFFNEDCQKQSCEGAWEQWQTGLRTFEVQVSTWTLAGEYEIRATILSGSGQEYEAETTVSVSFYPVDSQLILVSSNESLKVTIPSQVPAKLFLYNLEEELTIVAPFTGGVIAKYFPEGKYQVWAETAEGQHPIAVVGTNNLSLHPSPTPTPPYDPRYPFRF